MTTANHLAAARDRRVPGEPGTWVFLLGDMLVFGAFFVTFLVERAAAPELFAVARGTLHTGIGFANTLILLTSSLCVVVFLGSIRAGARTLARYSSAAAILCGLAFIGLKTVEYASLAASGHGPGANHFFLYYFILTGVHLFHVCVGLVVLLLLFLQARRAEISDLRMAAIEGGACFWHLVDLLWIVLFPLLYLVS